MTSDAYTVSKMLQSINAVMAPVATMPHATVSLKRNLDNGVMLDTSPQEISLLDLQAKVKHAAQQVMAIKHRGGDQDQWVADKRQCGNDAFREGYFQQAAELYVEALAGLDLGKTPEQRRACELQSQVPLTCNLVSCLLMMEQWEKAKQVCGQALQLDPTCVRALSQRAKALTRLARFEDARYDEVSSLRRLGEALPDGALS
jgi:tetratricopeptide (TPR) repeat protein